MPEEIEGQEVDTEGQQAEDTASQTEQSQPAGGSDVWTKEQVDAYTKSRIDKQNAKHAEETEALTSRLADATAQLEEAQERVNALEHEKQIAQWAAQASKETGVPSSIIRGETLEEMIAHANAIAQSMKPTYPTLPQDGGEGTPQPLTKEDINNIKDRNERVRAMALHDELYK